MSHHPDDAAALRELYELAARLHSAHDLPSIARLAARAAGAVLPDRGVLVQLWDDSAPSGVVEADTGREMSVDMHRERLAGNRGGIGELVVDVAQPLSEAELEIVSMIAAPTASAACAMLSRQEREEAQYGALLAIATMAERRDHQTVRHLERVAGYSRIVAEGLRSDGHFQDELSDAYVRDLERAAPLHDIGKVAIPDEILLKPGKLSPTEWDVMKSHSEVGMQTVDEVLGEARPTGALALGRDVAWAHHERWDGTGYPRGLSGDQIPLCARIVSIADIYDALTNERPYKPGWSHEEAIAWLRDAAGRNLDPRVVTSFLSRELEIDTLRSRLADAVEAHALDLRVS